MRCFVCGFELEEDDEFCVNCGQKVNRQQMSVYQAPMQPIQQVPMQPVQPMQQVPMQPVQSMQPVPMQLVQSTQSAPMQPIQNQNIQNMYETTAPVNNLGKKKKSKAKIALIAILSVAVVAVFFAMLGMFSKKAEHTIMIYMIGSDLETDNKAATEDIREMLKAKYGDDIKVVIQTGGAKKWWTDGIEDGKVQRFEVVEGELVEIDNLGKVNMVKDSTLSDFISFATEEYSADKYTLVLWDHGGGRPVGLGLDENFVGDTLTEVELARALKKADVKFETIVMDACHMSTLEVAMAIKDYAKYMVAAENVVAGQGMNYYTWLEYMEKNQDATGAQYGEYLASEYMDSVNDKKLAMSVIDLSKIDDVYDAYVDYIESVMNTLEEGRFVNYRQARVECGLYGATDSVDLVTLASKYETNKSKALKRAVDKAVVYTGKNSFTHGLAAYSPNVSYVDYSNARERMDMLGYDNDILECYDALASLMAAYTEGRYVAEQVGDWFDKDIVNLYGVGTSGIQVTPVEINYINGHAAISKERINWDLVTSIKVKVCIETNQYGTFDLGEDYYVYSKYDDIMLNVPSYWVYINGKFASYQCLYKYTQGDEMVEEGVVYATCNGENILINIIFDSESPSGRVNGYYYYDYVTQTESPYGYTVFDFNKDDKVEIVWPVYNENKGYTDWYSVVAFDGGDIDMTYKAMDLSEEEVYCRYTINDIYGNKYVTNLIRFN